MKYFLLFVLFFLALFAHSQDNDRVIDSLKQVIKSDAHDTTKISAYFTWDAIIYVEDADLDKELNERILELAQKNIEDPTVNFELKRYYYLCKNRALNVLGLLLTDEGDYLTAQEYLHESLKIAEYFDDSISMTGPLNNLGSIYKMLGIYDQSLKYYERAMAIDGDDPWAKSIYLNNIAIIYVEMGKQEIGKKYYEESIAISIASGNLRNQANATGNIGEIFYKNKDYDSALYYFFKAKDINREIESIYGELFILNRIGLTYVEKRQNELALEYCLKVDKALANYNSLPLLTDCNRCLYLAYKRMGNEKEALNRLELFHAYDDTLHNEEKLEELFNTQHKLDYAVKKAEDSLALVNSQKIKEVKLQANIDKKETQQYYLLAGLGILALIGGLIFRSYRHKKRDNEIIAAQKKEVELQRDIIDEKKSEILDSITYAKRIQDAILPPEEIIKRELPHSFILYQPKDVVSGDFYWFEKKDDVVYIAAADCTGHGVPGAMVSVVCSNSLNRAVNEFGLRKPSDILNKTRELVIETFSKSDKNVKDGMDIALCGINKFEIEYAGAHNPIWIVRAGKNEIEEIKADKQPVGNFEKAISFKNNNILLNPGDTFYIFSDGFADQFGGDKGKKFKSINFKKLICSIQSQTIEKQRETLMNEFEAWKGSLEQLDDLCIIGVKV